MILHIDMDAFYASVEEREQPALRGQPLVVGGRAAARGVVAAANYAARAFGVRSAMPTATALKHCPHLIVLPPRGALYVAVSKQIRQVFNRFTPCIEPLSLDEAFLDPHGSERLHGSAEQIGHKIKRALRDELQLVASVGVAPNKFLAKLASDHNKPDGFTLVTPDQVQRFLDPLPVARIPGIGKVAHSRLSDCGIATIEQLRATSAQFLTEQFGRNGTRLWQFAHGIDTRRVIPDSATKSISQETTFAEDLRALPSVEAVALSLTESVAFRLRAANLQARSITLKLRFHDFATITRSRSLQPASASTDTIWSVVKALLQQNLDQPRFALRLVGVGASKIDRPSQQNGQQNDLFNPAAAQTKSHRLDQLADQITQRYGRNSIRRGGTLAR